jgi:hypothetical protein
MTEASRDSRQLPENPASLLDRLQEPMEAIALGEDENRGRFCGMCYSRLAVAGPQGCPVCGTSTQDRAPVERVPDEVLAIYMAKRGREGLIVNLFAFGGIFLSLILSALLWFVLPPNLWRLASFAVLAFGSYYLARLVGYQIGVPIGSESGRRLRDRRWQELDLQRDAQSSGR